MAGGRMSEWLAGLKLVFDGAGTLYRHWLERRDPIRAQARRVLDVFAAHGVAPTQICRLLPEQFPIPMPDFASPRALKAHLSPALLNWVSEYFALNRSWLDGVSGEPHQLLCCYKCPLDFARWLADHRSGEPFQFRLFVLKPSNRPVSRDSDEDIVLTLEERIAYLDDRPIYRYYLFDGNGPLSHYPVVRSMLGMCVVADRARCLVKGRVLSHRDCDAIESGHLTVPQGLRKSRASWEPDSLLFQSPDNDSPWQAQLRADILEDLSAPTPNPLNDE